MVCLFIKIHFSGMALSQCFTAVVYTAVHHEVSSGIILLLYHRSTITFKESCGSTEQNCKKALVFLHKGELGGISTEFLGCNALVIHRFRLFKEQSMFPHPQSLFPLTPTSACKTSNVVMLPELMMRSKVCLVILLFYWASWKRF